MDALPETERAQLRDVVGLVRDVLADAAIGASLFGSAVGSGLRAESDLDILVVSDRRTSRAERRGLIEGLLRISRAGRDEAGKRHLEVTVVARPDIDPWQYPPPMELQYGEWWRRELESGDEPWRSPNPDLAIILASARADGVSLFGPPIADLVPAVPAADIDSAVRDVIPDLMADLDGDVRNVLLTLARIWFTLETRSIASKDVAAEWALARLPDGRGRALRLARAAYVGDAVDVWDAGAMDLARADAAAIRAGIDEAPAEPSRA